MKTIKALALSALVFLMTPCVKAATETVYFCTIDNGDSWETNVDTAVAAGWTDTGKHSDKVAAGVYSYPARFNSGLSITSKTYSKPISQLSVYGRVSNLARTLRVTPYDANNAAGPVQIIAFPKTGSGELVTVPLASFNATKVKIEFTVSGSATAYAYYVVVETAENQAPVWTSPFAPTLSTAAPIVGRSVSLNLAGCVSDPDGSIASITYTDGDALSGSVTDNACTLTFASAGTHTLTFTATDNDGASSTATYTLQVADNSAPALSIDPASLSILEGQAASASVSATDAEGDAFTLALTDGPDGTSFDAATGSFTWTPTTAGSFSFTFTATDSYGAASTATLAITVSEASQNIAPVLAVEPESLAVNVREPCTATISASDANGDTVTLSLVSSLPGATFNPDTGTFAWTPSAAGSYAAEFSGDDGNDGIASVTLPITVSNAAPTLALTAPTASFVVGDTLTLEVAASDLFVAPTLTLASDFGTLGAPTASSDADTFTAAASWSFTPTAAGTYTVAFTATDADDDTLTDTDSVNFSVGLATPALTVESVDDSTATLAGDPVPGATSYVVALSGSQLFDTAFLSENFINVTANNNNSITNNLNANTTVPGWTGLNVYPKGGMVQVGKGEDVNGESFLATPTLPAAPNSKVYVSFSIVNYAKHTINVVVDTLDAENTVRDSVTFGPFAIDSTKAQWFDLETEDGLDITTGDRIRFTIHDTTTYKSDCRILLDNIEIRGTGITEPVTSTQTLTSLPATLTDLAPDTLYSASITASDGTVTSTPASLSFRTTASVTFTIGEPVENDVLTASAATPIAFTVTASNESGSIPVTFEMDADTATTPAFTDGLFTWTASDADAGTHLITFRAGNATKIVSIQILERPELFALTPTPSDITWNSFTLNWNTTQPRDTGVYGLRIWYGSSNIGSISSDQETFVANPMLPQNWLFSRSFGTYNSDDVRLKLDGAANDWIISKLYPNPITSLKFTTNKYSGNNGSVITVYGSTGDTETWTEITSVTVSGKTTHVLESDLFTGKNYRRIKWQITTRDGNVGFGSVVVGYANAGTHFVVGSSDTPADITAAELPYVLSNAKPNTDYYVQLITRGDSGESLSGSYRRVLTLEAPKETIVIVR